MTRTRLSLRLSSRLITHYQTRLQVATTNEKTVIVDQVEATVMRVITIKTDVQSTAVITTDTTIGAMMTNVTTTIVDAG